MQTFNYLEETEKNGKIPFLDCLVTCDNKRMTFYRNSTYTDRLLDQSLHNLTSFKATTIWILTRRVQLVCDSPDSLQDETDHLYITFLIKTTTMQTLLDKTLIITLDQCQLWPCYDSDYTIHQRHL